MASICLPKGRDLLTRHNRLTHSQIEHSETATSTIPDPHYETPEGCFVPTAPRAPHMSPSKRTHHSTKERHLMPAQNTQDLHGASDPLEGMDSMLGDMDPPCDSEALLPDDLSFCLDNIPGNSYNFQPLPLFDLHFVPPTPNTRGNAANPSTEGENSDSAERRGPDLSAFGSRLPSLQPEDNQRESEPSHKSRPFSTVTEACRVRILEHLNDFSHLIPDFFALPSRHALSRYVAGYFAGFHEHYPMIHVPSFHPETVIVDLLLSMAALGAQYCREAEQGLKLFHVAKAITLARIALHSETDVRATEPVGSSDTAHYEGRSTLNNAQAWGEVLQCLILFVAISTWFEDRKIAQEAFSVLSTLDFLIREDGLECPGNHMDTTWEQWVVRETIDRTKLLGFCFFNLYTILFNIPPLILSSEIDICLPSTEKEWRAESAAEWEWVKRNHPRFQQTMRYLLDPQEAESEGHAHFSSLGGYVLIHGVIQNIWLLQRTSRLLPRLVSGRPSLSAVEIEAFERGLKQWSSEWERNQESSMDPVGPYGPVSFNSTALLRLAYIRINTEVGSVQSLRSWNPAQIALTLHRSPPIQRSIRLTRAVLHCAHALSIPVKLGINFVAHTQVIYWSNQHALCSLESASLLSKWLQMVTIPGSELTPEERRLLNFVLQIVTEAQDDLDPGQLLKAPQRLSIIVVRLWAKLFRSDSVWQMVGLVGRVLEAYASLLERDDR